jgi:hypothetical protein
LLAIGGIYEEKKKAAVQISLDRFVRKVEEPGASHETDVEASPSRDVTLPTSSYVADPASHEYDIDEALQTTASTSSSTN